MRFLALAAVLFLSGCSLFSKGDDAFFCPRVGLVSGGDRIVQDGARGVIGSYTGTCAPSDQGAIRIDLTVPFAATRTDGDAKAAVFPYFVAVLSPGEEVMQRTGFTVTVPFDATGQGSADESHRVTLPGIAQDAYKYKVVVGFALTPEQLQQNKDVDKDRKKK